MVQSQKEANYEFSSRIRGWKLKTPVKKSKESDFTSKESPKYRKEAEYNRVHFGTDWKQKMMDAAKMLSISTGDNLTDDEAVSLVRAMQTKLGAGADGKWGTKTDRAYRNFFKGESAGVKENIIQTNYVAGSQQFESTVSKFASQIGDSSASTKKFVSDSLKVFYNASAKGVINSQKFVMVNPQNSQLYIFDMVNQKIWKSTYAALGSGGINTRNGSHGTPDGLSFLNGPNSGGRGGFLMSGSESFNRNNDSRTIRLHDRKCPKHNLPDNQKTTWGCIGVTSTILNQMLKDPSFYKAGVFVWTPNSRSQYL
ncbi:MAG: hypothetical protein NTV88_02090 [Candidatus Micrarchaeota archaeon]|nr:hypothetical protein [Candidatus Micrarchaeota archaeon]